MFPTRLQVKQHFWSLLDDPSGVVFTDAATINNGPSLFQSAFSEAYDVLFNAFLNQQVSRVEQVVQGIIVPPSPIPFSLTPAAMGIADFADWDWLAERLAGSTDKFIDLYDSDRLTQRGVIDRLLETVFQNGAFQFAGCTTPRELQMKYVASGEAPTADGTAIGIDSCLNFLANYAVGVAGGRKGYEDIASRCMNFAVGPKFHLGSIGGELFRLTQPLVRSRQNVVVAHKPYTTTRRIGIRRRGIPYVSAQQGTTGGGAQHVPIQYATSAGTIVGSIDGVNTVFYIIVGVLSFTLYKNGVYQTLGVDYTAVNNQITFLAASIPQSGDVITAEAYPQYQG